MFVKIEHKIIFYLNLIDRFKIYLLYSNLNDLGKLVIIFVKWGQKLKKEKKEYILF